MKKIRTFLMSVLCALGAVSANGETINMPTSVVNDNAMSMVGVDNQTKTTKKKLSLKEKARLAEQKAWDDFVAEGEANRIRDEQASLEATKRMNPDWDPDDPKGEKKAQKAIKDGKQEAKDLAKRAEKEKREKEKAAKADQKKKDAAERDFKKAEKKTF